MNCYIVLDEICRYNAADELRIFCAFWRPILPALSLHALSTLALFTCRFHYLRNPYPKMFITRSFITRALSHPLKTSGMFFETQCKFTVNRNYDDLHLHPTLFVSSVPHPRPQPFLKI